MGHGAGVRPEVRAGSQSSTRVLIGKGAAANPDPNVVGSPGRGLLQRPTPSVGTSTPQAVAPAPATTPKATTPVGATILKVVTPVTLTPPAESETAVGSYSLLPVLPTPSGPRRLPAVRDEIMSALNESFERCCSVMKTDLQRALAVSVDAGEKDKSELEKSRAAEYTFMKERCAAMEGIVGRQAQCIREHRAADVEHGKAIGELSDKIKKMSLDQSDSATKVTYYKEKWDGVNHKLEEVNLAFRLTFRIPVEEWRGTREHASELLQAGSTPSGEMDQS